jgi:hypothetical protein
LVEVLFGNLRSELLGVSDLANGNFTISSAHDFADILGVYFWIVLLVSRLHDISGHGDPSETG